MTQSSYSGRKNSPKHSPRPRSCCVVPPKSSARGDLTWWNCPNLRSLTATATACEPPTSRHPSPLHPFHQHTHAHALTLSLPAKRLSSTIRLPNRHSEPPHGPSRKVLLDCALLFLNCPSIKCTHIHSSLGLASLQDNAKEQSVINLGSCFDQWCRLGYTAPLL